MLRSNVSVALFVSVLVLVPAASQAALITNANFEALPNPLAGWTGSGSPAFTFWAPGSSGSYCARAYHVNGPSPTLSTLSQTFDLPAGINTVIADFGWLGAEVSGQTYWAATLKDLTTLVVADIRTGSTQNLGGGWTRFTKTGIDGFAGHQVQLTFTCAAGVQSSMMVQVDNVNFIPEPTGAALLALGGAAVALRHWRRGSSSAAPKT